MDCAVEHGRVLLMVADEQSFLDAVTTFKPDLVVVGLSQHREEEANIARLLMERHPDLRLIVLSVHTEQTVVGQMLSAGIAGFVLKRAAATDLIPAIEEVLRGQVYVSAVVQQDRHESSDQCPAGSSDEE
jgi:two-component system secretion response regulator SsrB